MANPLPPDSPTLLISYPVYLGSCFESASLVDLFSVPSILSPESYLLSLVRTLSQWIAALPLPTDSSCLSQLKLLSFGAVSRKEEQLVISS